MYADMHGMADIIAESMTATGANMTEFEEGVAVIRPLHTVTAAISASETSTYQTVVLFIERQESLGSCERKDKKAIWIQTALPSSADQFSRANQSTAVTVTCTTPFA